MVSDEKPLQGQCVSYVYKSQMMRAPFGRSIGMIRAKLFRPSGAPTRVEQKRQADRWRGSASSRGYNHRWAKARVTFLARAPFCIGCEAVGRVEPATVVDHVDPHHGDPEKFWDTSMWQPCCKWHHDSIKQMLEKLYAARRIPISELWLNSETAKNLTRGWSDRI